MRNLFPLLLIALCSTPLFADDISSYGSYDSDNRRVAKAAKLIKKEQFEKAVKELRKAVKSDVTNADAWNLLGFASRKLGDFTSSSAAYEKALIFDPEHKGALEYQGQLFITLGSIDKAKSNLKKLTTLCPSGCEELTKLEKSLDNL